MTLVRGSLGAALVVCGALAAAGADGEADKAAREKLVGVWTGHVVEGASDNPDRGVMKLTLTITGEQISATAKDGAEDLGAGTYMISLASDPPQLDASRKRPNGQVESHEGIYSLQGDILKWCVTNGRARKRPEEFTTKPGGGQFLLVLRRQAADK
jgi:uncharacterized protein (TIGR03067 family)